MEWEEESEEGDDKDSFTHRRWEGKRKKWGKKGGRRQRKLTHGLQWESLPNGAGSSKFNEELSGETLVPVWVCVCVYAYTQESPWIIQRLLDPAEFFIRLRCGIKRVLGSGWPRPADSEPDREADTEYRTVKDERGRKSHKRDWKSSKEVRES